MLIKHKTYVIAEIGLNHNGSVDVAKQLIEKAKNAGSDAVKFQIRNLKSVYTDEALSNKNNEQGVSYIIKSLKCINLSKNDYIELGKFSKALCIDLIATPFDVESAKFIKNKLVPKAIKIGSPDLTNSFLLNEVKDYSIPIIMSTGMSSMDEIRTAVGILKQTELYLLHCTSTYPSFPQDLHLKTIEFLNEEFDIPIGYSSHEKGYIPTLAAVACGAQIIERHITLNQNSIGPDHAASLTPKEFKEMISAIREVEMSMGSKNKPLIQGEKNNALSLRKSLIFRKNLKAGATITYKNLNAKSPAKGITPQEYYKFIGKRLKKDVKKDEYLDYSHIKKIKSLTNPEHAFSNLSDWGLVVRLSDINEYIKIKPHFTEVHLTWRDVKYKDLSKLKLKYDFGLSVHAPEYLEKDALLDLTTDNENIYQCSINHLKNVTKFINTFSNRFSRISGFNNKIPLIIHPGGHFRNKSKSSKRDQYARLIKALKTINWGVVDPLIENLPPFPWYYGGQYYNTIFMNSDEIIEFCNQSGYSICLDISHAALYCNANKLSLSSFVSKIITYTKYLHISDAEGVSSEGLQIGEGNIDFSSIKYLFLKDHELNQSIPFIPEIWQGHLKRGNGFKVALEKLSNI